MPKINDLLQQLLEAVEKDETYTGITLNNYAAEFKPVHPSRRGFIIFRGGFLNESIFLSCEWLPVLRQISNILVNRIEASWQKDMEPTQTITDEANGHSND